MNSPTNSLLRTPEAAAFLGLRPQTLESWRCLRRQGPAWIKIGRLVAYRREDLIAWLDRNRQAPGEAA